MSALEHSRDLAAATGTNSRAGHVVIIGGGHAGGTAAALLREMGWSGAITLVCEESGLPYQRPPLSKGWLKGEVDAKNLTLRPSQFYTGHDIVVRQNSRAVAIEPGRKTVVLDCGTALAFSHLIVATGAAPLSLPGAESFADVLALRTMPDAERIRGVLRPGSTLAIVGGGFVGLEVAATARLHGMNVVVIEREPQLMARVASAELANFVAGYFEENGVRLELGRTVEGLEGEGERIAGVLLSGGNRLSVDAMIVGIGARPNDEILRQAGIACERGVIVDESACTSDRAIFAIGDCTNRPLPLYGTRGRLESVPNALEQARQAVSAICGRPALKAEVPWFWSDQGKLKIQIAGLRLGVVETVTRGVPNTDRFAVFHLDANGAIRCVEAVNAAPEFMMGKNLIAQQRPVSRERLQDVAVSIRDVAA
jgi:3-phenylpropionate/trans-cinnamate dioxygenase ferredoxin reductase subunit